jgi:hypothetical protein
MVAQTQRQKRQETEREAESSSVSFEESVHESGINRDEESDTDIGKGCTQT